VKASDRLFGLILIALGLIIAVPVLWFLLAASWVGLTGRRGWTLLTLIPLGLIFHGALFLVGVHPKSFYAWWENLSDLNRAILVGFLVIVGVGVFLVLFVFGD
jgi:hypothetical protein